MAKNTYIIFITAAPLSHQNVKRTAVRIFKKFDIVTYCYILAARFRPV